MRNIDKYVLILIIFTNIKYLWTDDMLELWTVEQQWN